MWVSMGCGTVSFSLLVCYSLSPLFVSESTTSVALSTAATILFTFWQRMTLYGSLICDLMYLIMDTASKQWMYLGVQLLLVLYFWTKLWPGFTPFLPVYATYIIGSRHTGEQQLTGKMPFLDHRHATKLLCVFYIGRFYNGHIWQSKGRDAN